MNSIYRNFISILLLFAGVVIFSHSVIPHDHHYNATCDTEHHEHHDEGSESPMHCHFLNDIVFDEVIISVNQIMVKDLQNTIITLFSLIPQTDIKANKGVRFVYKASLPDYQLFIKQSPTRGSPIQLV
jgi:hypothetical protein